MHFSFIKGEGEKETKHRHGSEPWQKGCSPRQERKSHGTTKMGTTHGGAEGCNNELENHKQKKQKKTSYMDINTKRVNIQIYFLSHANFTKALYTLLRKLRNLFFVG